MDKLLQMQNFSSEVNSFSEWSLTYYVVDDPAIELIVKKLTY